LRGLETDGSATCVSGHAAETGCETGCLVPPCAARTFSSAFGSFAAEGAMESAHVTSRLLWTAAAVTAPVDILLLALVSRAVQPERFARLRWGVTIAAGAFWFCVWAYAMWGPWWGQVYHVVFPEWARDILPPAYALMFAGISFGFWTLARRAPRRPALAFCLLGGLVSFPGHAWGIWGRGMLEKSPLFQDASPASALTFGFFEFIVYWSAILLIAALIDRLRIRTVSG